MNIWQTEKESLTEDEILGFINKYQSEVVPKLDKLWEYYIGHNTKILKRGKAQDANNPDNRVPVPYGRKIITTYSGYAFRPRFITYKSIDVQQKETEVKGIVEKVKGFFKKPEDSKNVDDYYKVIQDNFSLNKEHIKTNRAGRNTAIFGMAYELVFVDSAVEMSDGKPTAKNTPKFVSIDPREMILFYDFSIEPQKKIAIRFFKTEGNDGRVEVYYNDHYEKYIWTAKSEENEEKLTKDGDDITNFFG
ncbi:MAG: phage portal protein, partial [Methanobacterium sp.]